MLSLSLEGGVKQDTLSRHSLRLPAWPKSSAILSGDTRVRLNVFSNFCGRTTSMLSAVTVCGKEAFERVSDGTEMQRKVEEVNQAVEKS